MAETTAAATTTAAVLAALDVASAAVAHSGDRTLAAAVAPASRSRVGRVQTGRGRAMETATTAAAVADGTPGDG